MKYGTIKKHDVANGLGVRVSLFVSGCTHHCEGCFNPETWDFNYGQDFTDATADEIIEALKPNYIRGFSVLGGEPFEPANQKVLATLLKRTKETYPEKTIWCYSGYNYETDMLAGKLGDYDITKEMLSYIDVLIDGEFHLAEKNLKLRFRGSSNQRIIDVPASLKADKVVLWDEKTEAYDTLEVK